MGQVGTPIIAIEGGRIRALGWNQYGGWRIGIDSFDGKRYYYYAHLRQNRPYAEGLSEGDLVQAGDVIGYMGRTGYSACLLYTSGIGAGFVPEVLNTQVYDEVIKIENEDSFMTGKLIAKKEGILVRCV